MSDPDAWYAKPEATIRTRFDVYRSIGVQMRRISLEWRSAEHGPVGDWSIDALRTYLLLVKEYGFRLKPVIGVIMGPPKWFLETHPEARLIDQNGKSTWNAGSYWDPGLRELIDKKTERLLEYVQAAGLLEQVDYLVVDAGSAGEPLYPPTWTLAGDVSEHTRDKLRELVKSPSKA
jgi:hypothetical protein